MSNLFRLVFNSRNALDESFDNRVASIAELLAAAQRNNRWAGVTGAIVCHCDQFTQMIEGPRDAVETTFERIQRDSRHENVAVLAREPATARLFPGEPMTLLSLARWDAIVGRESFAIARAPDSSGHDGRITDRRATAIPGECGAAAAAVPMASNLGTPGRTSLDSERLWAELVERPPLDGRPTSDHRMAGRGRRPIEMPAEFRVLDASLATLVMSSDRKVIRANPTFFRLFDCDQGDVVGQGSSAVLGGQSERTWEALQAGDIQTMTSSRRLKDGSERWIKAVCHPVIDDDGRLHEVVVVASDVTAEQERAVDTREQVAAITTSQAVVQFAVDGTILDANPLFLKAMGYTLDEVVGRHHRMFVDPAYAESADYDVFWASLAAGRHQAAEFARRGRDGRTVWLQASYNPIFDPAGRLRKIVKYASDVTAEKLRQADYQWQIAAIHKSHAVITFDMHGTIIDVNQAFLETVGYSREEVDGRHHRMFVDPSYAHGTDYAAFWRHLKRGNYHAGQYKRIGKNGREVWLQATYNPIFDMDGRPIKVVKFATDITEEKRRQADQQGQIASIHMAQCVISFDLDGCVIDANDNFLDVMGFRLADLRGANHRTFVEQAGDGPSAHAAFWSDLARGRHQAGEYKFIGKGGRERWFQATYNPIFGMSGRPFKVVLYATDVTAEKLRQAEHEGQIAAIYKSQGVIAFDLDGTILDINGNFLAMLGYELDEVRGRHHRMLVGPDEARGADYAAFWQGLRAGAFSSGMYKRVGKDGREVWIQASYNPIFDLNGRPFKVIKYATDVTSDVALAKAFEDAKRQAQHDPATSLPNRVRLASFMTGVLAQADRRLVVLYLDLDRFKPINDMYGHPVGDRVLGEIADRLRRALSPDQLAARVGGDEFVVAAPDLREEEIEPFCQRLMAIAAVPIDHDGSELRVGLSIGIAMSPTDGTTPDELLRCADIALYRSKRNGRGIFSFFATIMNDRVAAHRGLVDDMRRGIAANEFFLEYQPRYSARHRTIQSVEALVRWAHPERGCLPPLEFIPLAERSGLIVPLGEWILRTACEAATAWGGIGVSVNVSPVQFRSSDMVEVVHATLSAVNLDPGKLELEITEHMLFEDVSHARSMFTKLKALGVKLAMDDFGTGFSSLNSLRSFPFDIIKIDRQFTADIQQGRGGREIIQAILSLGRALGLSVTAEGVETEEQLSALIADECAEVQGFVLARPMAASKIAELLAEAARDPDGTVRAA